ncbi:MAG: hypothetical protein E6R03_13180 [Hyphomicrobiaceae bacterium]|nr:MAG: hypothetical protein E6R03_13180 [Hyphomicrobiaceae bacterium]
MIYPRKVLYYKTQLQPLEQHFVDREVAQLTTTTPATEYLPGQTMAVWTAVMLRRLPFMGELQWQLLLRSCAVFLRVTGSQVHEALQRRPPGKLPACQLAIVDGRYATWTAREKVGFLDLETGEDLAQLAFPPLESLSYNLVELARREKRRHDQIQKLLETSDAGAHDAK